MIALVSPWKLKGGCPPRFAAALEAHTAVGPPPEYPVDHDPDLAR